MARISRLTQKLELFRGNSKEKHSPTTRLQSVSQQKQIGFQKHLQIRFTTMFRFETMESTAEPTQSNQQETSNDTRHRQPIAVTHQNMCAAITSWQNKNTIQSQNSLPQSPKSIETSPQPFTETTQQWQTNFGPTSGTKRPYIYP
jgi:hypothetical protein